MTDTEGFGEIEVFVDGALTEVQTFINQEVMGRYILSVEADAVANGKLTEVHMLWHDHNPADDCTCGQHDVPDCGEHVSALH